MKERGEGADCFVLQSTSSGKKYPNNFVVDCRIGRDNLINYFVPEFVVFFVGSSIFMHMFHQDEMEHI